MGMKDVVLATGALTLGMGAAYFGIAGQVTVAIVLTVLMLIAHAVLYNMEEGNAQ